MNKKTRTRIARVMVFFLLFGTIAGVVTSFTFGLEITYTDENGDKQTISDFLDTRGHWAQNTIRTWAEYEVVNGIGQGKFDPNAPVKRGDVAIMLDNVLGLETMAYNSYEDLSSDAYYRDAILKCTAAGLLDGFGVDKINAEQYATREEVAIMLARAFKFDVDEEADFLPFRDYKEISDWTFPSVKALYDLGYMQGYDYKIHPKDPITRAEIMTLFNNIAEIYIPNRDTTDMGDTFSNEVENNIVASRDVTFVRTEIGRDFVLTPSARSAKLESVEVGENIVVLSRGNITLERVSANKLKIYNKARITGITDSIKEVFVSNLGSETQLDAIPKKMILESGARVKIGNTMYENTTNDAKEYLGLGLKEDIANEQGYIIGGPKILGYKANQKASNDLEFLDVRITQGDEDIDEIGFLYNNGTKVPTINDYDKRYKYTGRYDDTFEIDGRSVNNERTYRLYTIDDNGLMGYSDPITLVEYEFDIDMNIYDVDYPEKMRGEIEFEGDNIPKINSVKMLYNTTQIYSEEVPSANLSEYQNQYEDDREDYKRYTGTINAEKDSDGNPVAATEFGYVIQFSNGSVINEFPVLTNAFPDGIAPVDEITAGYADFTSNNNLYIRNSKLTTRHVPIQEVGLIYREVPSGTNVIAPQVGVNGWVTKEEYSNVDKNETEYFTTELPVDNPEYETHYTTYIKTSTGYYFGEVKIVNNSWTGEVGGPIITNTPKPIVLSSEKTLLEISTDVSSDLDFSKIDTIITLENRDTGQKHSLDGASLTEANYHLNSNETLLTLEIDGLVENSVYDGNIQLFDINGKTSNAAAFTIDTSELEPLNLSNKTEDGSYFYYDIEFENIHRTKLDVTSILMLNGVNSTYISDSYIPWRLYIENTGTLESQVQIEYKYYISNGVGDIRRTSFTRYVDVSN